VALRDGTEIGHDSVETSGEPARLVLTPDRASLAGNGQDAVPVTVSAVDAQGRPVPTTNLHVHFEIEGAGAIIGVGNGDPNSHESEKAPERNLYNGLAQVIVQSQRGGTGNLKLRAKAEGLQTAETVLVLQTGSAIPAVPEAKAVTKLAPWRISPAQAERPDPNRVLADNDMNSWGWGEPPLKQEPEALRWRSYRAPIYLRSDRNDGRSHLVFREIVGKAEIWVDGIKLGEKTTAEPGPLTLPLAKGSNGRTLTLLLESQPGQASGVIGQVIVEPGAP
jgi:beta-galactosidase